MPGFVKQYKVWRNIKIRFQFFLGIFFRWLKIPTLSTDADSGGGAMIGLEKHCMGRRKTYKQKHSDVAATNYSVVLTYVISGNIVFLYHIDIRISLECVKNNVTLKSVVCGA